MLRMRRRKWLQFRALNQAHHRPTEPHALAYLCLAVLAGGVAALCAVNDQTFINETRLQVVAHAAFCIAAACMYAAYKIALCGIRLVLSFAEASQLGGSSHYYYYEDAALVTPRETDEPDNNAINEANDDEEEGIPDTDSWDDETMEERIDKVPREVVVSSMYLGGVGSFLAIAPLCMWDTRCTAAFLVSLLLIGMCCEPAAARQHLVVAFVLAGIIWMEVFPRFFPRRTGVVSPYHFS